MKTFSIKPILMLCLMFLGLQGCKKDTPDAEPAASFTFQLLSNGGVQFTDKSTSPRTWAWDFGDGQKSTQQNPKTTFEFNGEYEVTLTVTNNAGQATTKQVVKVSNGKTPPLTPDFTFTLLPNGEAQFTNTSKGATYYTWDFGDGTTSKEKSPKASFNYNDTYTVKLTAYNDYLDSKTVTKTVTVANGKAAMIVSDEWSVAKVTSGGNTYSFRNHFYELEITEDNKNANFTVESGDIDVDVFVFNSLGQIIIDNTYRYGRKVSSNKTLNKGKYLVEIATRDRYAVGKYTLTIKAIANAPTRVVNAILKDSKDFGADGGGGYSYGVNGYFSPKNKKFTFEVTENNTWVDIDLASNSADTRLRLYDYLGKDVGDSYGGRRRYISNKYDKGVYTIYVATTERDAKTDYSLEIVGKVQKLVEDVPKQITHTDKWNGNNEDQYNPRSYNEYTFDVTEDNSYVDLTNISVNIDTRIRSFAPDGSVIEQFVSYARNHNYVFKAAKKGMYKIRVLSYGVSTESYTLKIVGQVANLKKL